MQKIILTVSEAKSLLIEINHWLAPLALADGIVTDGMSDRSIRDFASVIREQVLISDKRRASAVKKTKVAS